MKSASEDNMVEAGKEAEIEENRDLESTSSNSNKAVLHYK